MYSYKTSGVCSRTINFDIVDNKVVNLNYVGGCDGNLKGLSQLIEGMEVTEVIKRLQGISCGGKDTSCPDQLTKALEAYLRGSL